MTEDKSTDISNTTEKTAEDSAAASVVTDSQEIAPNSAEMKTKQNGSTASKPPVQKKKKKVKNPEANVPRGMAKSGRPWKSVKTKFATVKKSIYRRSFEKKVELREELKHIKELSKSIKEDKQREKEAKKQRRLENAQRRLENERKAEVVQIIKNPAKLKRMRKKQLRQIEKRDLDNMKVV